MLNDLKTQLGVSIRTVQRALRRPVGAPSRPEPANAHRGARAQAREEHHQRVRRMRRALYLLLEQHPSSRELLRHLDLVERTLRHDGFSAVEALPANVIAKALAQLERLVSDWSPEGLAELRSRLAVIVKTRAPQPARPIAGSPAVSLHPLAEVHTTEVTEVDHAAFEEMERSWTGRIPDRGAAA